MDLVIYPTPLSTLQRQPSFLSPLSLAFPRTKKIRLLSHSSPLCGRSRFRISAQFHRRSVRQNHLRRKIQRQEVSGGDSVISSPISQSAKEIENVDRIGKNLDSHILRESTTLRGDINLSVPSGGESLLLDKLENWVEQYRKDTEFWGIGTCPIFTVYGDSQGKVERVVVNEDEILRRSRVPPPLFKDVAAVEDLSEVNEKLSVAKSLAREMETGKNVIPTNSSVAKFLISDEGKLDIVLKGTTSGFSLNPSSYKIPPHSGIAVLCGLVATLGMKTLFKSGKSEQYLTRLEKEMLRRKREARVKKEKMVIGGVEVVRGFAEHNNILSIERPELDKEKLMTSITNSTESRNKPRLPEHSSNLHISDAEFENKIHEIRELARHARELEDKGPFSNKDGEEKEVRILSCVASKNLDSAISSTGNVSELMHDASLLNNVAGITEQSDSAGGLPSKPRKNRKKTKSRIITSVKEAREYLSRKCEETQERIVATVEEVDTEAANLVEKKDIGHVRVKPDGYLESSNYGRKKPVPQACFEQADSPPTNSMEFFNGSNCDMEKYLPIDNNSVAPPGNSAMENSSKQDDDENLLVSPSISLEASTNCEDSTFTNEPSAPAMEILKDVKERVAECSDIPETPSGLKETAPFVNKENWLEKNFHVLEPVIKKMQTGFRDNYLVAKDKSNLELDAKSNPLNLESSKYGGELEWVEDERLQGIVFKVRDNELAGRDPFFLMSEDDKLAFFDGLEKKVEQENKQLLNLHEWLHANIENLDYGTDGISLYDPPQKIMPRWRSPPMEKIQELLNSNVGLGKTAKGSTKDSSLQNTYGREAHLKPAESPSNAKVSSSLLKKPAKAPKTIIEGSDGSTRAGKKSGKEYWEHTKKWSREFLESYNAETDPEIKSIMRNIGKDLDRWITEKEIQEASELIDGLPNRGKKFISEKLDKVRREMEVFGPQAVVSKYREYGDEKEEDYLWWLDLPHILCIEMYIKQEGEMKVGFYSLEMASDLQLDPPPNHVIGFEDAGDCKNMCYIIQAHLESLGHGNAFVVAQHPKDAFRAAKANGFGVTVIKKGELQLNVDQRLEEVEEFICEIGSKIYHDRLMRERGVDMEAVVKGMFGTGKEPPCSNKTTERKQRKLLDIDSTRK
ncbi:unnamed protein product [Cuscuta campestris]|uniref:Uncharacterized protein n=1 Tax=Cuscuta campestris TaxID=132261 RepID=A0A484LZQ5_9ASTE|nr:unnamed protein product [Cuscuta campestris]